MDRGTMQDLASVKEKDSQLYKVLVIGDYAVGSLFVAFFCWFVTKAHPTRRQGALARRPFICCFLPFVSKIRRL